MSRASSGFSRGGAARRCETWIVLELCSLGSLQVRAAQQSGATAVPAWLAYRKTLNLYPLYTIATACKLRDQTFLCTWGAMNDQALIFKRMYCASGGQATVADLTLTHPVGFSLQGAIDGGAFRVTGSVYDGLPDLPTTLLTALEVARALEYLHSKNVVHGARLAGRQHRHAGALQVGQWPVLSRPSRSVARAEGTVSIETSWYMHQCTHFLVMELSWLLHRGPDRQQHPLGGCRGRRHPQLLCKGADPMHARR